MEIAFRSLEVANLSRDTNDLIAVYCQSKEDNYMMELLAKITKRALYLNIVSYDDLFILNEKDLMLLLDNNEDDVIKNDLYLFKNIMSCDIPDIFMPLVKKRGLCPIVGNKRISENE